MRAQGRTTALAVCLILIGAVVAPTAGADGAGGAAPAASPAAGTSTASAAAKRCRIVRVKKRTKSGKVVKRGGKPVYVRKRKCKPKAKPKPKETTPQPQPNPTPTPPVIPPPPPPPPAPRIELVGWSTQDVPGATPPADLVPNGGTITSCVENDRVSVWVRQFGFTTAGPITTSWTRAGSVLTSGASPSTIEGANRYFLIDNTPPLLNATYQVSWSYSGGPIASASVTLDCPP